MRITKQQAAENRERVVAAAARLFRKQGLDGVGIDAVAADAGLTHGAIYSHFKSKDDLAAAAVAHALRQSMGEWLDLTDGLDGRAAFVRLLKVYVSRAHRDHAEAGCSIAALGGDASRGGDKLADVFLDGTSQFIDVLSAVSNSETEAGRRRTAIARAAAMVGALVLARAASADPGLSDEILKSVRTELLSAPAGA